MICIDAVINSCISYMRCVGLLFSVSTSVYGFPDMGLMSHLLNLYAACCFALHLKDSARLLSVCVPVVSSVNKKCSIFILPR